MKVLRTGATLSFTLVRIIGGGEGSRGRGLDIRELIGKGHLIELVLYF